MNSKVSRKDELISKVIATVLLISSFVIFLLPLLLVISISFTPEVGIKANGFLLFPESWSLEAYKAIFADPSAVIKAYIVTAAQAFLTMAAATLIMAMCAYPLSRKNFVLRGPIMFMILFTMLFHGGLIPTYILNSKWLGLKDTFWIYVLPSLVGAWYIIVLRTFFSQLPDALVDSAKIDGAKELRIFFQIVLPLSKPVLATVSLLILLDKWNDWMTSLIYITNQDLYTLQYLLQRILDQIEFVKTLAAQAMGMSALADFENLPGENMRFAMSVVAAGPMMLVFPFFQKYFVKGLTVGSVKG
ncbi:MAG: carbohydrate ABC transporter permease [Eubacteriales bacterium]